MDESISVRSGGAECGESPPMDERGFGDAIRQALKDYTRPDRLRTNPLLASLVVRGADPAPAPGDRLRALLKAEVDGLGGNPKCAAYRAVLLYTYIEPLRSQECVAEKLNLSWSTYRRRLKGAMQMLTARLWEAEQALSVPADDRAAHGRQRTLLAVCATLLLMAAGGIGYLVSTASLHAAGVEGGVQSVAVLPFVSPGREGGDTYLSDALSEELINALGRSPELHVAARTSSFYFKGKNIDARRIGKLLGVRYLLEGTVQRAGERLRVSAQLVDSRDGYTLWSAQYDLPATDLFSVEDTVARRVLTALALKMQTLPPARSHPVPLRAHDLYMAGLEYLNRRTVADINRAMAHFRRALAVDPNYAAAWNGLAMAYTVLRDYDSDDPPDTYYADALAAAGKAATLDASLSRPHAVLGSLHAAHWEWRAAAREFRLALKLDPSDATAHQWYAMYMWAVGDMQGALRQMQIAHSLDPLSRIINVDLGAALQYAGQLDAAIAQFRATIASAPDFALPYLYLADAWRLKGRLRDALKAMQTAARLTPTPHPAVYVALLGIAYAHLGDRAMAERQLAELEARARHHYVSHVLLATVHSALGNDAKAFKLLARGVAEYDHQMLWVVIEPEDWAADARYRAILADMHLPLATEGR